MLRSERISTPLYKKIILFVISFVVFTIQLTLLVLTLVGSFYSARILYFIGSVLGVLVTIYIINSEAQASYKLTWIVLILILPLFFVVLYFMNRSAKRLPQRKQRKIDEFIKSKESNIKIDCSSCSLEMKGAANLIKSNANYLMYKNTNVVFFKDALEKHEHMLEKLKQAQKFIYMEYFIISGGSLLQELLEILKVKGEEGVEIKILYDDIGSRATLPKSAITSLMKIKNLELCVFNPLGFEINPAINYRNHQKVLIIDGKYAYCGGDNLADEYIHRKERFGYWRDNACFYEGDAVMGFLEMFSLMWFQSSKQILNFKMADFEHNIANENFVIPFGDGPYSRNRTSYEAFMYLISSAQKKLYISTPYLIIDDEMLNAIALAKKSGVDVKVLVPHIPDKKTVFMLTQAHYKTLLKSGVEIYEYTPGFNHAKNIIVDDKMAFVGTINMDYRSLFLHYECGAIFNDTQVIEQMEKDFHDAVSKSELYTQAMWNKRNPLSKFFSFLIRVFAPML